MSEIIHLKDQDYSFFGRSTKLKGEFNLQGVTHIAGQIEGDITMNGKEKVIKIDIVNWENVKEKVEAAETRIRKRLSNYKSSCGSATPHPELKKFIKRWGTRDSIEPSNNQPEANDYSSSTGYYSKAFERVFPGLIIKTNSETCPGCKRSMTDEEINSIIDSIGEETGISTASTKNKASTTKKRGPNKNTKVLSL